MSESKGKEVAGSLVCCLKVLPKGSAPISETNPGKSQDNTETELKHATAAF